MSFSAAIITVGDRYFSGERENTGDGAVRAILGGYDFKVDYSSAVPDDMDKIKAELIRCADELAIPLVFTVGGSGLALRDVTPEATLAVIERECRGIPEAIRYESMKHTPRACLSRGVAGARGRTLIINLPGSGKAVEEGLPAVMEAVAHAVAMLA